MIPSLRVLERVVLSEAAASQTFENLADPRVIPAGSRHLAVVMYAKGSAAGLRAAAVTLNGDTGANYNHQSLSGKAAVDAALRTTGAASAAMLLFPGSDTALAFGLSTLLIPHAWGETNHKAMLGFSGAAEEGVEVVSGRWASGAAVTTITLTPDSGNFAIGTEFLLCVVDERFCVEEQMLTADGTVTFDNFPALDADLVVIGYARTDEVAVTDAFVATLNADGGASYSDQSLLGVGAGPPTAATQAAQTEMDLGHLPGASEGGNEFGVFVLQVPAYNETVGHKALTCLGGPNEMEVGAWGARWASAAAITSIELAPEGGTDFVIGSLFSLYIIPKKVITRTELAAPAATIPFAAISANYAALGLSVYGRGDDGASEDEDVDVEFNADAGPATYDTQELDGTGGAVTALDSASDTGLLRMKGSAAGASEFGAAGALIFSYTGTVGHGAMLSINACGENMIMLISGRWENTVAITGIILTPGASTNFDTGTVAILEAYELLLPDKPTAGGVSR